VIRIDTIWLATEPMDMRAGTDTAMARVISVFGAAQPHCAAGAAGESHSGSATGGHRRPADHGLAASATRVQCRSSPCTLPLSLRRDADGRVHIGS